MKHLLLFLACILVSAGIYAQTRNVSGTIRDVQGNPIPGVTVMVPGTTNGTVTDADGRYNLSVSDSDKVLDVIFVGMKPAEINLAKGRTDCVLEEDSKELDDVVVVAYGSTRREAKTGAISTVHSDELADIPGSSFEKILGGKMAGVMVTTQNGQPGAGVDIRVRGTSSINAGNNPLYVIDGVVVMSENQSNFTNDGNSLAMLNPDDVESITILKDAAASSIYGSRAANGVVIITTKSGKAGKSTISARAKMGFSKLANDNDFGVMSAEELFQYRWDSMVNAGIDPNVGTEKVAPMDKELLNAETTDWMDHLTRHGKFREAEISVSGGNEKTTFYSSINYHKNEGIAYGVDFNKITARVNADHQINEWVRTGARVSAGYSEMNDVPMQSLYYSNPLFIGMVASPWDSPYTEEGDHNVYLEYSGLSSNPRANAKYDQQYSKMWRLNGSMYLQVEPIKGLTIKSLNAAEYSFEDGLRFWHQYCNEGETTRQITRDRTSLLSTSNTIAYENKFAEVNSFRVLLGQEASKYDYDDVYAYGMQLNPSIPYLCSSTMENNTVEDYMLTSTMFSLFGLLDYNYDSRYYLSFSLRRDGSSRFGKDKRFGTFWSIGGSWNAHNESFLKDVEWVNFLKLRASYGINGNNDIADYKAFDVYQTVSYNGFNGLRTDTPANNDLSWELNRSFNIGFDFSFMKRFTINFDYYKRTTEDMLLDKPVSRTTGYSDNTLNVGKVENKGVEIQASANVLRVKKLSWNIGGNIAFNKSKIVDLAGQDRFAYSESSRLNHVQGERLYTFYLREYAGVDPQTGDALFVDKNGNITTDFNESRYITCGSPEPKFTGGFNTDVSWKGLSLSAQFEFKYGNKVFIYENTYFRDAGSSSAFNQAKTALNYWKKPGDANCDPKPIYGNSTNASNGNTTRWLEDGSYLRIKDVTLAYSLPRNLISNVKLQQARIYVSAVNLFTFHSVEFWDPERGADGLGVGIYPVTKSFMAGIDITF